MPTDPYSSRPSAADEARPHAGRNHAEREDRSDAEAEERDGVTAFLDEQLRSRPVPTLLAAVAAGWIVGKILR